MNPAARLRSRGLVLVAVLALTALGAGCGSNQTTPSAQVTEVVHGFLSEQVDGSPSDACDFLTGPARVELVAFVAKAARAREPKTCADALGLAHDRASKTLLDALRTADITDIHVNGSKATVMVRAGAAFKPQEVSLKRSFGNMTRPWKIDGAPHLGG